MLPQRQRLPARLCSLLVPSDHQVASPSDHPADEGSTTAPSRASRVRSALLSKGAIAAVGTLLTLMCWGLSSPPGSAPDEPYHLASAWCAWGTDTDHCGADPDPTVRLVPHQVANGQCFTGNMAQGAECRTPDYEAPLIPDQRTQVGNWAGRLPTRLLRHHAAVRHRQLRHLGGPDARRQRGHRHGPRGGAGTPAAAPAADAAGLRLRADGRSPVAVLHPVDEPQQLGDPQRRRALDLGLRGVRTLRTAPMGLARLRPPRDARRSGLAHRRGVVLDPRHRAGGGPQVAAAPTRVAGHGVRAGPGRGRGRSST